MSRAEGAKSSWRPPWLLRRRVWRAPGGRGVTLGGLRVPGGEVCGVRSAAPALRVRPAKRPCAPALPHLPTLTHSHTHTHTCARTHTHTHTRARMLARTHSTHTHTHLTTTPLAPAWTACTASSGASTPWRQSWGLGLRVKGCPSCTLDIQNRKAASVVALGRPGPKKAATAAKGRARARLDQDGQRRHRPQTPDALPRHPGVHLAARSLPG